MKEEKSHSHDSLTEEVPGRQVVRVGLRGCTGGLFLQGFLVHAADILCAQIEDLGPSGKPSGSWYILHSGCL